MALFPMEGNLAASSNIVYVFFLCPSNTTSRNLSKRYAGRIQRDLWTRLSTVFVIAKTGNNLNRWPVLWTVACLHNGVKSVKRIEEYPYLTMEGLIHC